jgi:hypothetical protein
MLVAAPIGLVILVFYLPKFVRNKGRRRKYAVILSTGKKDRISGSSESIGQTS